MRRVTLPGQQAPANTTAVDPQQQSQQPAQGGWGRVTAQPNAQTTEQTNKIAGPSVQPLSKAAGGWGKTFTQPDTVIEVAQPEQQVDDGLAQAGSFSALEQLQQQVLQPGEMDPRFVQQAQGEKQFAIQTGGERIDPAQAPAATTRKRRTKAQIEAEQAQEAGRGTIAQNGTFGPADQGYSKGTKPVITFDVGLYITQRTGQGFDFTTAYNEAATIVEGLQD